MRPPEDGTNGVTDLRTYSAVLFDLDGVLTPTADVHKRAWQVMFQEYLADHAPEQPYTDQDYYDYLDGRQRYEGVATLLDSRGLQLPWGQPSDTPEQQTVCGLGNRKDAVFRTILDTEGVQPYPGSVALVDELIAAGTPVAVVSSSRNARMVLAAAGLAHRFAVVVDGATAAAEGMASKPDPATFLRAAQILGVRPGQSVVVEDALPGVQAGSRGGFELVVGVDRGTGAQELLDNGAHMVVTDLAQLVQGAGLGSEQVNRQQHPAHEWRLIEHLDWVSELRPHAETLFAVGNGYLGLRGNDEEANQAYEHGTFINGFHETWPIEYPEKAYGFAEVGQTILNLPDPKPIRLAVDGEWLHLGAADIIDYQRVLDMQTGVLHRSFVWRTGSGQRVKVSSERMVSFERKNLCVMTYEVTPLDHNAQITVESLLLDRTAAPETPVGSFGQAEGEQFDPRKSEDMTGALLPKAHGVSDNGEKSYLAHATGGSGLGLAIVAAHALEGVSAAPTTTSATDRTTTAYQADVPAGTTVKLHKLVAYHDGWAGDLEALFQAADATVTEAQTAGVQALLEEQSNWLASFWADADVVVPGQPEVQQAIRWNLFQLAQASARADGRGVSAKGVSGSGYSGHYFWDTEIYVLPYLTHTYPPAARNALQLRHTMLPAARRRAEVMSEAGALFAWRTINGEEASAYYPAGTAQYHINADITYAVSKYAAATGDSEFVADYGAEIAVETARMWLGLGFFKPATGQFHINAVTGPDEYSAVVDDNFYTNVMAAFNLRYAAGLLKQLESTSPQQHARLIEALAIQPDEPEAWLQAADAMALPYDEQMGMYLQDARWLEREPWDIDATPAEKRPLLLHFHPLVIYRHQVLKQADLVLALYLHASQFSAEDKRKAFDYYDPLTTGDSSLSAAVQSIMAAEVGYPDLAMRHFETMLFTDLADLHQNTADGVHVACAGGTWQALVAGFGGMRDDGDTLRFYPRLPEDWESLSFVVRSNGAKIRVLVQPELATFTLEQGTGAMLELRGVPVTLSSDSPTAVAPL